MSTEQIPATPVVLIKVEGDQVTVNNDVITHDGTKRLHEVAVHAAAERVAAALGRPVRAEAIDAQARTRLVIHPDGHASGFEVLEEFEPAVPPAATQSSEPQPCTPPEATADVAAGDTNEESPFVGLADLLSAADAGQADEERPAARVAATPHPPTRERRRPVAWPFAAAAVVALVGSGLAAAAHQDDAPARAGSSAPAPTGTPTAAATRAPSAAPSPRPVLRLRVEGRGAEQAVQLRVRASRVPTRISVVVAQPGRERVRVTRMVREASTVLTVPGLTPGLARWVVRADAAPPVTGVARIRDVASTAPVVTSPPAPTPTTSAPTPTTGGGSTSSSKPSGPKGRDDKKKPSGPVGR